MTFLKSIAVIVWVAKRGISEVVASILLIAVISTASFLAVTASSKQILEKKTTVSEALHEKGTQIQELVSVITSKADSGKISFELLNYGIKEITVDDVLVDGKKSAFTIKENGKNTSNIIPKKKIIVLETNTTGNSIQLVTGTGNLIGIKIQ
jgi:flagellin-like protein